MKIKSFIRVAMLIGLPFTTFAQLKVDQYGRIGMGTNYPNSGYKCHIKGNLLLTTHPDNPAVELQFKVGSGLFGAVIGTNVDYVAFWSQWVEYNNLLAQSYLQVSDKSLKTNIKEIANPLQKINLLKTYKYDFIDKQITEKGDSITKLTPKYGFISQEVEEILDEVKITEDAHDLKLMDYDQIIPLLVAGMQEQQKMIDSLKTKLGDLQLEKKQTEYKLLPSDSTLNTSIQGTLSQSKINNCYPNPFNADLVIDYQIESSEPLLNANLIIFNSSGQLFKEIALENTIGKNAISLSGSFFSQSGSYIIGLKLNGQVIDTKIVVKQ
ncbi:MAG TPA: tail fiber domain-containing protein [Crocinitomicaceae bacterium]|nr:tail fiber domain-containing protein [Crocinitomicaceae bacterium]